MLPKYESPSATSAIRTPNSICQVQILKVVIVVNSVMSQQKLEILLQALFLIRVVCLGFMNGMRIKISAQQLGSHFQNAMVPCKFNDISYGKWYWENLMVCSI